MVRALTGLSYNFVNEIAQDREGVRYTIPRLNIIVVVIVAYGSSLLATYLPARQAANVYPVEALRHEQPSLERNTVRYRLHI